jgi:hypothetical protein
MRILLACAAFPPYGRGGGPIDSALIARALATQPTQVRVLVVGDAEAQEQRGNIKVITTAPLNVYRDWLEKDKPVLKKLTWHLLENFNPIAYRRMKRELQSYRPDVLVTTDTQNINVASWAAAKTLGIPCVHLAQGYFLLCWRSSLFRAGANCSHCLSCRLSSVGKNTSQSMSMFLLPRQTLSDVCTKMQVISRTPPLVLFLVLWTIESRRVTSSLTALKSVSLELIPATRGSKLLPLQRRD